ncbi:hydra actinoporin-like toxin 7 [Hypanus sabinus]|uniref:hydra actinoporin-like toxin 7 n=1 Tax=Hypanus sabinus TaxID=79690 RepID=UPI0028C4D6E8|nr:hydra actinoporin-like toxin 7 [Hypanus sabinus]
MSNSIEEIMQTVDSTRCVGIEISNKSRCNILTEPATYNYSGRVHSPPPPTIDWGQKGVCIFIKTPHTACGAVGVLSYNFGNSQISLMVSNPYDYSSYSIEYALYVHDQTTSTDYNLYNKMYNELTESDYFTKASLGKCNSCQIISKKGIYVSATMSNEQKAILKIDIRDAY